MPAANVPQPTTGNSTIESPVTGQRQSKNLTRSNRTVSGAHGDRTTSSNFADCCQCASDVDAGGNGKLTPRSCRIIGVVPPVHDRIRGSIGRRAGEQTVICNRNGENGCIFEVGGYDDWWKGIAARRRRICRVSAQVDHGFGSRVGQDTSIAASCVDGKDLDGSKPLRRREEVRWWCTWLVHVEEGASAEAG